MAGAGLQPLNIFLIVFPFAISLFVVVARIWKRAMGRQLGVEDTLLVIAECLIAVLTATVWKYVIVSYSGYHAVDIPKGAVNLSEVLLWRYINNAIYNPILGLVKISFLITLHKLQSPNRWVNRCLWALVVVNILFIFATTFGSIFMCWPVKKSWYPMTPGTCGNRKQYIFGAISVTIITDVLVTIIPAWILHDLHMSRRNKISVAIFLSLPLAVTAIGVYRLYTFVKVFSLPTLTAEDPYNVRNALSNIESNLGVLAACGPTIKWILGVFFPYFRSNSTRPSNAYTPTKSSRFQTSARGYKKSHDDIELTINDLDDGVPAGTRHMQWDRDGRGSDAHSEERIIMRDEGIKKTVVVDWKSETRSTSATPGSKTVAPRNML